MRCWLLLPVLALLTVGATTAQENDATRQVPYKLTTTKHVLVRAKVNGKGPYNLVLDTGAPVLILAKKLAEPLKVEFDAAGWATLNKFELEGGVVLENVAARFEDLYQLEGMNGLGLAGVEIHGLVGYPILAQFRITYDFAQPKLTWTKLDAKPVELPRRQMRGAAPGGLDVLGGLMKNVGKLFGMGPPPKPVARGFLGLNVTEQDGRLVVANVVATGPADRAEIRTGDRVLTVNGKDVTKLGDFRKAIGDARPGDRVKFTLQSSNAQREVSVECGRGF